jgi:hypothetical protein
MSATISSQIPEVKKETRKLFHLALPLMGAQLAQMGMGVTDAIMAGQYNFIDLAGVALGGSLLWPIMMFVMGLIQAVTPTVAQLNGARDYSEIGEVIRQGLWMALTGGIFVAFILSNIAPVYTLMKVDPAAAAISIPYLKSAAFGIPALMCFFCLRFLSDGMGYTRPALMISVTALMTKVTAGSNGGDILDLISFILASYLAIAIMFFIHALLITLFGVSAPFYFKQVWPVLTFAFTSRSSAATIPLNVETQIRDLGNHPSIANFSATFGSTIGQNGCAGIYPAMLAVMIAPTMGVDPLDFTFIMTLIGIVAISSFGVAGVGGGATFAALMVLPALGFPVALAALLISIEPLIDMARTALNVNGAMTAGTITDRVLKLSPENSVKESYNG